MLILLDKIKIKELKSFNNLNYTIIIHLKARITPNFKNHY